MSFFGDIPDELIYSNELVDPPVSDTIGGLPLLGPGIAGIYTPSRKLGQANNPGQQFVTSGPIQVTKAQKRDARTTVSYKHLTLPTKA